MDSYTNFRTAFLSWADNDDVDAQADNMLTLVHARLNRMLKLEEMTTLVTASTTAGSPWVTKPDRYNGMRRLKVNTGTETEGLDFLPLGEFDDDISLNAPGRPTNFTILGDRIRLGPIPDGVYTLEMAYWKKQQVLSSIVTTNVFLEQVPDLLLYGCLVEAEPWLRDNEMFVLWEARYKTALQEVMKDTEGEAFPDGQLAMRHV